MAQFPVLGKLEKGGHEGELKRLLGALDCTGTSTCLRLPNGTNVWVPFMQSIFSPFP